MGAILQAAVLTMSSREIADLVESRHDNVKVTIERLVARGVIESPALQEIPTATKPVMQYLVGKRDSYVIVAQLSPEFTARLVDRWQELEARVVDAVPAVPQTFADALRLAADRWAIASASGDKPPGHVSQAPLPALAACPQRLQ